MNRKKILIIICAFTLIITVFLLILIKSKSYKDYYISKNKWDSVLNKRSENKNLKIESINFNEYELVIDESKSTIYYSMVKDSNSSYNPNIKFKLTTKSKLVILEDDIIDEKIGNHEFKIMIYNDSSYHVYSLICTKFPILSINYNMEDRQKNDNRPVNIYLFDNLKNSNNRITRSDGRMNAKNLNSYVLQLELLSSGKNIRDNIISIMGMEPSSKYILTKVDKLDEDLINENTRILELFIENKYIGLYKIDILK